MMCTDARIQRRAGMRDWRAESRRGRSRHPASRDTRTSLCFAGAPRSGDATGECRMAADGSGSPGCESGMEAANA